MSTIKLKAEVITVGMDDYGVDHVELHLPDMPKTALGMIATARLELPHDLLKRIASTAHRLHQPVVIELHLPDGAPE